MKRIKEKKEEKILIVKGEKSGKNNSKKTVSCNSYEWIKKDLGTVDSEGYTLRSIEMSGERGIIIEHWEL